MEWWPQATVPGRGTKSLHLLVSLVLLLTGACSPVSSVDGTLPADARDDARELCSPVLAWTPEQEAQVLGELKLLSPTGPTRAKLVPEWGEMRKVLRACRGEAPGQEDTKW